jgi:hypothetical protein
MGKKSGRLFEKPSLRLDVRASRVLKIRRDCVYEQRNVEAKILWCVRAEGEKVYKLTSCSILFSLHPHFEMGMSKSDFLKGYKDGSPFLLENNERRLGGGVGDCSLRKLNTTGGMLLTLEEFSRPVDECKKGKIRHLMDFSGVWEG